GGGRYDGLAEQLGGPPTPGVGFGQGLERLLLVLAAEGLDVGTIPTTDRVPPVYVASVGDEPRRVAFRLLDRIRFAGVAAVGEMADRSLRAQMKSADRAGARFAVIVGEQEIAADAAGVRDLRSGSQESVALPEVAAYLVQRTGGAP
ncbi:MAG: His/Gly/Thr/Pro-type tRNA ligase C-terminal domain-containing protein, partial [bacterium]